MGFIKLFVNLCSQSLPAPYQFFFAVWVHPSNNRMIAFHQTCVCQCRISVLIWHRTPSVRRINNATVGTIRLKLGARATPASAEIAAGTTSIRATYRRSTWIMGLRQSWLNTVLRR
jgi:hypothetical protein